MNIKTKGSKVFIAMILFAALFVGQAYAATTDSKVGTQDVNNTLDNSLIDGKRLTNISLEAKDNKEESGSIATTQKLVKNTIKINKNKKLNSNVSTQEDIKVSYLRINRSIMQLKVGENYILSTTVEPSNATNKTVKWTTSDPSIAQVSESGVVTALKPGFVVIRATTQDGSYISDSCDVGVIANPEEIEGNETDEANIAIKMTSGDVYEYNISMIEINKFVSWVDGRAKGEGSPYYIFEKKTSTGSTIKEYLMYDKIVSFTINKIK